MWAELSKQVKQCSRGSVNCASYTVFIDDIAQNSVNVCYRPPTQTY